MSGARVCCSFCTAAAAFGPYGTTRACEPCARRVVRLAIEASVEVRSAIWATSDAPAERERAQRADTPASTVDVEAVFAAFRRGVKAQIAPGDVATHLRLAEAYLEMGLHEDAAREAVFVFHAARDRAKADEALRLLLSAPLLRAASTFLSRSLPRSARRVVTSSVGKLRMAGTENGNVLGSTAESGVLKPISRR
jgi:hypothetical protein